MTGGVYSARDETKVMVAARSGGQPSQLKRTRPPTCAFATFDWGRKKRSLTRKSGSKDTTGEPSGTHSPTLKKVFSTSASSGAVGIRSASRVRARTRLAWLCSISAAAAAISLSRAARSPARSLAAAAAARARSSATCATAWS